MSKFDLALQDERDRLARRIAAIDVLLEDVPKTRAFLDEGPTIVEKLEREAARPSGRIDYAPKKAQKRGHKMSAAVREKIRKTQQARWDKIRKERGRNK